MFAGYELIGPSNTLSCTSLKTYDFPPPSCVPVSCGHPDSPQNGYVELFSGATTYLHNATYLCHVGYELNAGKIFFW